MHAHTDPAGDVLRAARVQRNVEPVEPEDPCGPSASNSSFFPSVFASSSIAGWSMSVFVVWEYKAEYE